MFKCKRQNDVFYDALIINKWLYLHMYLRSNVLNIDLEKYSPSPRWLHQTYDI